MTPLEPCPFCKKPPVVKGNKRPSVGVGWFIIKCVSRECSMRIVETMRCGDEDAAAAIWNQRVA